MPPPLSARVAKYVVENRGATLDELLRECDLDEFREQRAGVSSIKSPRTTPVESRWNRAPPELQGFRR